MLIPRAVPASVTFTNNKDEEYRLVVEADDVVSTSGEPDDREDAVLPPPFVKDGQTVFLTFQIDKPGTYAYYAEPKAGGDRDRRHDRGVVRHACRLPRPRPQGVLLTPCLSASGAIS